MRVIVVSVLVRCLDNFSLHPLQQQVPLIWNLSLELYLHIAANEGLASIVLKPLAAGAATERVEGGEGMRDADRERSRNNTRMHVSF